MVWGDAVKRLVVTVLLVTATAASGMSADVNKLAVSVVDDWMV